MNQEKRMRARAIIIKNNQLVSMYRENNGKIFYTFPGGGAEGNETEQECVTREVFEEFGINIKPINKLYTYENNLSIEHFYLCEWISGKFGSGTGEEYEKEQTNGIYKPTMIDIEDIPNLPLMPPEVASKFFLDYHSNKDFIRSNVKFLHSTK